MVIKIMYPNNDAERKIGIFTQEFVYETSSYCIKHIFKLHQPKEFEDILSSQNRQWYHPEGLEFEGSYLKRCTEDCASKKCHCNLDDPPCSDCANCDCGGTDTVTLLTMATPSDPFEPTGSGIPLLLTGCNIYIMNDKGETIDRIIC